MVNNALDVELYAQALVLIVVKVIVMIHVRQKTLLVQIIIFLVIQTMVAEIIAIPVVTLIAQVVLVVVLVY